MLQLGYFHIQRNKMVQSTNHLTVYKFLSETADRRSRKYKELDKQLDSIVNKFGKDSKEVRDFFNQMLIL